MTTVNPPNMRRRWQAGLLIAACGVGVVCAGPFIAGWFDQDAVEVRFHEATSERLELSLIERGRLDSQSNVKVHSRVEDIRGDGIRGNAIVWMVPNGAMVKEGDLIVMLDSGTHVERVDEQTIETDQAEAAFLEAKLLYENQVSINETLAQQARLKIELAKLELEMFQHPTNGTHRLEVDAIKRQIDDTENELLAAKARLQLSQNDKDGLEELFRLGYSGRNKLEEKRLDHIEAQSAVTAKLNRLRTHVANLTKKNSFDRQVAKLTLEGALKTATQALTQVELDNAAELAKAQSKMEAANRVLNKERELLVRYKQHLEACNIHAPQTGMVAYSTSSRYGAVELGTTVYEGQHIMSIPDLRRMNVLTAVHETSRNLVKKGMTATIRLEAFPDRSYQGKVERVDLMPDRRGWSESDTKVYKTVVSIDGEVHDLKPGLTAIVEFHIQDVEDAVTVPVESILYEGDEAFCYLRAPRGFERRTVKLGVSARNQVQIVEGIRVGETVVLNPSAISL